MLLKWGQAQVGLCDIKFLSLDKKIVSTFSKSETSQENSSQADKEWSKMDDENGGLFNIEVSSGDEAVKDEKVPRDFQSEEDFQGVKTEWKPNIEIGEV